jgi:hypothetical protein
MIRGCRRLAATIGFVTLLGGASTAFAQTAPSLGAASSFAVLGGTASVTNTGSSVLNGDVGDSSGAGVVPGPAVINGNTYNGTPPAPQAQLDAITAVTSALNNLEAQTCTTAVGATTLGPTTFTPGVYCFGTMTLNGPITFDALGNPNAVFIIKITAGNDLTNPVGVQMTLAGGAQSCNVFWAVARDATVGVGANFIGNILAGRDFTAKTGANVLGRALAGRAVVLDTNNINATLCGVNPPGGSTPPAACVPTVAARLPTITSIPSQAIPAVPVNGSVAVGFTIGGAIITDALVVSATSSNLTLVPQSAMVITRGVGGARVLTIFGADGRSGVATITVTVTDPTVTTCTAATTTSFQITIGTAAAVPTLPPWALLALTALLALAGFAAVRRRST